MRPAPLAIKYRAVDVYSYPELISIAVAVSKVQRKRFDIKLGSVSVAVDKE